MKNKTALLLMQCHHNPKRGFECILTVPFMQQREETAKRKLVPLIPEDERGANTVYPACNEFQSHPPAALQGEAIICFTDISASPNGSGVIS